ncbi:hypothetical protein, partial [Vibrio rotiferianus]|uniref:hypothetical protein n=1 Tax=Vibrio rotiferianus TaxID=190895 RepID=UPI001B7FFB00
MDKSQPQAMQNTVYSATTIAKENIIESIIVNSSKRLNTERNATPRQREMSTRVVNFVRLSSKRGF